MLQWGHSDLDKFVAVKVLPLAYTTYYSAVCTDIAASPNGIEALSIGVGKTYPKTMSQFIILGKEGRSSGVQWFCIGV